MDILNNPDIQALVGEISHEYAKIQRMLSALAMELWGCESERKYLICKTISHIRATNLLIRKLYKVPGFTQTKAAQYWAQLSVDLAKTRMELFNAK